MTHVVHVIGALIAGGAETFVVNLVTGLNRTLPTELIILSPRRDARSTDLEAMLARNGVTFHVGPNSKVSLGTVLWYRSVLGRIQPDAIHLHTPNTELVHALSFYGRLGQARVKLFRTVHSLKPGLNVLTRIATRMNATRASVAVSDGVMQTLASEAYPRPHLAIANGVHFSWPIASAAERLNARQRLGLNPDASIFLSVGRMSAQSLNALPKAQDLLLQAWQQFQQDSASQAELHLLGDGNLRPELERTAPPATYFHGVQSNVPDWLLACDFYLMPSRFEGMPIAGIEALGSGCRCLFSRISPLQQIACGGEIWVEPDDIASLTAGLKRLLATKTETIPQHTVERFRQQFDLRTTVSRYHDLYLGQELPA